MAESTATSRDAVPEGRRAASAVSPLLPVIAVVIRGTAGAILAIGYAVIAIPWLTVIYVQRHRRPASGDALPELT
jgi:hypothetical protein